MTGISRSRNATHLAQLGPDVNIVVRVRHLSEIAQHGESGDKQDTFSFAEGVRIRPPSS